ncbi:hypothetical protein [Amycolatopsis cihanbeyliensis]|uniref:Uncharacterized protein n=1 Tax=Amycolatopsis cihanbeyliensis TaxID=1128664 RepID=A0A542DND7_AMYCI|nr:hypothetical protein [Amycolatopsis cihanbeyliensis]TQJ04621.1 hypothetical protein FB471_4424 [Amycolatopsis cihanbeyliensis]
MISPAQAEANQLLCCELYRHLDEADFLAGKWTKWSDEDIQHARALIPDLLRVIRAVLDIHQATWQGTCRLCYRPWPCATVQCIHRVVKDPDREFVKLVRLSEP